jgi:hypothetical protein
VTPKVVTINTPRGPVKRLAEIPLRPEERPASQPQPAPASQSGDCDVGMSQISDDTPIQESTPNKVIEIYIGLLKGEVLI